MNAVALTNIAPQVAKLLRLLASPVDGEVLGAARALKRVLGSAKLELHDLANLIEVTAHNRSYGPSPQDHAAQDRVARARATRVMIMACRDCFHLLKPKEREFVLSIEQRRGELSDKQFAWLADLYAFVERERPQCP